MSTSKSDSRELVLLLQDIERRSRESAFDLPHKEEARRLWEGVLYSIGGHRLLTSLDQVREILNYPTAITPVPGALPWVHGVANVRGNLLPILDLQEYLEGKGVAIGRRTRILVINHEGLLAGLIVGEVHGMRHFQEDLRADEWGGSDSLGRYIDGAYQVADESCPVFSMHALAEDPAFQVAAA